MASLYQNSAPGRPPGGGGPPPGGAFRPSHGPQPQHPPPGAYNPTLYGPPPPPPGAYNPNPYPGGVALPPPPTLPPPPMPPPGPYGGAPPPPPPPSGPPQHPPPPPPQYHPSAPHYGPPHKPSHHHSHPQHVPHQPGAPHGSMNPHHQNVGHANHAHQASLNQGHNPGHGGNRSNVQGSSHSSQHRSTGSQVAGLSSQQASRNAGGQGGASLSRGGSLSTGTHQSRRPETEEERRERKKKEYERSKAEERAKRSSQPGAATSSRPGAPVNGSRDPRPEKRSVPAADKIENRLKRPSTFLCKIRFRNELPDPVSQPKLMHINNDKDQYTKYTVTSLENKYKHKLYVEPDLGIPLDLLDLSAYNAPQVRPQMDPADADLLLDDEVVKKETTIRKKERPTDKGVAWLVKTQYISPLSLDPAKQAISEKQAKELKDQREGERLIRGLNDRDQQIQAIEESFRVAKQIPVHQTKPELEVLEVLPLLPYLDRWSDQFVHMIFDTDPTGESEILSKMDEETRDDIESRAIVKSFFSPNPAEDQKPEKFVAYMVPKPEELERDIYEDDEDISYTWVREYYWDLRTDPGQSTYVFCFDEDGVNYLPLHTKIILQKKKAKEGRPKEEDVDNHFPVPSRVTVHRRNLTEEESRAKVESQLALLEGEIHDSGANPKRRRSPEPAAAPPAKRKVVVEEAVLNREDISEDEEMSV